MGTPIADCCGGLAGHGSSYLGPEYDGIQLSVDPKNPLPFASPAKDVFREEQAGEFELLGRLPWLLSIEAVRWPSALLRSPSRAHDRVIRGQALLLGKQLRAAAVLKREHFSIKP